MKFPNEHIEALQSFGYTQQEARFLYIVAIHSGYFTQRQYCEFGPKKTGCIVHGFTTKLVARGHAIEHRYQNNTRVLHFTHKAMYCAISKKDIRNRRKHTFEFMKGRLAILDFVLLHLQHDYLEGEAEKIQYFDQRFQVRPQDMPGRTYRGANNVPDTIRHFVDKFPLFLDSTVAGEPPVTLTFIDAGAGTRCLTAMPSSSAAPATTSSLPPSGLSSKRTTSSSAGSANNSARRRRKELRKANRRSGQGGEAVIQRILNSKNFLAFLLASATGMYLYFAYPFPSANLFLRAIEFRAPLVYREAFYSYTAMLFTTPYILFSILLSGLYIFALQVGRRAKPSQLPSYPDPSKRHDLSLVVGEVHNPRKPVPSANPRWLTIPERGLYTGIAIFGAMGSGNPNSSA